MTRTSYCISRICGFSHTLNRTNSYSSVILPRLYVCEQLAQSRCLAVEYGWSSFRLAKLFPVARTLPTSISEDVLELTGRRHGCYKHTPSAVVDAVTACICPTPNHTFVTALQGSKETFLSLHNLRYL